MAYLITKDSDIGRILKYFQRNPLETHTAIPFASGVKVPFIGYSASARMCELRNRGLLEVVGTKPWARGQKFNLYGLTKAGKEFEIADTLQRPKQNLGFSITEVELGEVKTYTLPADTTSKFLGTTNIPNPNYKKPSILSRILS